MADGCITLAQVWDSAWLEGNGKVNITYTGVVPSDTLWNLYMNDTFLPSYTLDQIGLHLTTPSSPLQRTHTPAHPLPNNQSTPTPNQSTPTPTQSTPLVPTPTPFTALSNTLTPP